MFFYQSYYRKKQIAQLLHLIEKRDIPALKKFTKKNNSLINYYIIDKCTPLDISIGDNAVEVAKLLLKNGADPNFFFRNEAGSSSPLMRACYSHNLDISLIEKLIEHGANVNVGFLRKGKLVETPLMNACFMGQFNLIECLLKNQANTNIVNVYGITAVGATIESHHYKNKERKIAVLKLLLSHGAVFNPNQKIRPEATTMEETESITMKEYVRRSLGEEVLQLLLKSTDAGSGNASRRGVKP